MRTANLQHSLLCSFVSVLIYSTGAMAVSEAEQIALEASPEDLLPSTSLVQRIDMDLKAIRSKFPHVAGIGNLPGKWGAGQLIATFDEADKNRQLDAIRRRFGETEARSIFHTDGSTIVTYLLIFSKPYNPVKLGAILEKEFGVLGAHPDGVIGSSQSITLTSDTASGRNTYVFFTGSGDCPSGCINRSYFTYSVGSDGKVQKVETKSEGYSDFY